MIVRAVLRLASKRATIFLERYAKSADAVLNTPVGFARLIGNVGRLR